MKFEYHDQKVFDAIRIADKHGATESEIRKATKFKKVETEPTIEGLLAGGQIVDSGAQRPATTRKGSRLLPVYVTADVARATSNATSGVTLHDVTSSVTPRATSNATLNATLYKCPACRCDIVRELKPDKRGYLLCDPQQRLVVFAGPYDENGCCTEPLNLIEEGTGRYVSGRAANENERKHFGKHKTLDGVVSWTIGRVPHLRTCDRWDLWITRTDPWSKYDDIEKEEGENYG